MITVGSFYKDKVSKEVYEIVSVKNGKVKIEHTVEDEAWFVDPESFSKEYTLLRGKLASRAEILADVIKQLDTGFLKATSGIYCSLKLNRSKYRKLSYDDNLLDFEDIGPSDFDSRLISDDNEEEKLLAQIRETEINKVLKTEVKQCLTCAIGSVFISAVDIHNKLKFKNVSGDSDMVDYLSKWFSDDELRTMEDMFETSGGFIYDEDENEDFLSSIRLKYGNRLNSDIKLREIIANTLKFDEFDPEKGLARKVLDKKEKVG